MPTYKAIIVEDKKKRTVIKNAPSSDEAERQIQIENPKARVLDIGREAAAGEECTTLQREYK